MSAKHSFLNFLDLCDLCWALLVEMAVTADTECCVCKQETKQQPAMTATGCFPFRTPLGNPERCHSFVSKTKAGAS